MSIFTILCQFLCVHLYLIPTFAKDLVETGTPLDQMATLLVHERLETTTRVYLAQPSGSGAGSVEGGARERGVRNMSKAEQGI